jgi:hypothetical protein
MPSCRDSDVPPGLRPGSFSTRTSSDWHDAGMPVMAADEIRAALAEAGAWPRHAIRAELEARAEIMDLLRRGDGMVPITESLVRDRRSVIYKLLDGGRSKREVDGLRAELQAAREQLAPLRD